MVPVSGCLFITNLHYFDVIVCNSQCYDIQTSLSQYSIIIYYYNSKIIHFIYIWPHIFIKSPSAIMCYTNSVSLFQIKYYLIKLVLVINLFKCKLH